MSRLLKLSEVFSGLKFVEHLSLQQVGVQFAHFDASYINALWHLFFFFWVFFLGPIRSNKVRQPVTDE